MAGGAKASTPAGEGKKVLLVAVSTFHPNKIIAQIAAVQPVDDLLEMGTEEYTGPLKPLFVPLDEGFKTILDAPIIIGSLRIAGPINSGLGGHNPSLQRKIYRLL
jgi:hypothetical protein